MGSKTSVQYSRTNPTCRSKSSLRWRGAELPQTLEPQRRGTAPLKRRATTPSTPTSHTCFTCNLAHMKHLRCNRSSIFRHGSMAGVPMQHGRERARARERERVVFATRESVCRTSSLDTSTSATFDASICATLHTSICAAYIPPYAPYVHSAISLQSTMRYH